ncbi:hypothetical protein ACERLL_11055 [Thiohalorhabdus sp. Cl-TMA]|uniref:Uncharacterized protein n=1 Tax=Thiohalorhabdus methylotrophus TaxID=3242694 RepID=A0ABV4TVK8_9GAMM
MAASEKPMRTVPVMPRPPARPAEPGIDTSSASRNPELILDQYYLLGHSIASFHRLVDGPRRTDQPAPNRNNQCVITEK